MKKLLFLFLILVSFFSLISCFSKKEIRHPLLGERYIYNKGDTLIYSDSIYKDTFIVSTNYFFDQVIDKSADYENLIIGLIKDSVNYSSLYSINRTGSNVHINWANFYSSFDFTKDTLTSIYIKNVKYECYRLSYSDPSIKNNNSNISQVYYTNKYGIIRYDYKDGRQMVLSF